MKKKLATGLVAISLLVIGLGNTCNAGMITIDFDDFPNHYGSRNIGDLYLEQGVIFYHGNDVQGKSTSISGSAQIYRIPRFAVSGTSILLGRAGTNRDIIVHFFDNDGQRTTASYAGIKNDLEAEPDIFIAAYDEDGSELGSTYISGPGEFGAVEYPNIWSVMIYGASGSPGTLGVDDFTFSTAPVPVPAAAWLLGSAFVGVLGLRRIRKS